MGTLITIEGGDGSGKATQTERLLQRLTAEGYPVRAVSFPDYASPSSTLVKMYLAGEFGERPEDVNPYVASTFYAVDRFASFRKDWKDFYEAGGIIIADRYTTSNMVHQMTKYESAAERLAFLDWLEDLEYEKFALPRPDCVCLLDVDVAVSTALMREREHKTGGQTGDIHEKNRQYLMRCHAAYQELVARYGWLIIPCDNGKTMDTVETIHERLFQAIQPYLPSREA